MNVPRERKKLERNQCRCLIIDDHREIINIVSLMLSGCGYRLETADNKRDVISKLAATSYDLIVTDLEMPDMNGYQLAVEIKKENRPEKVIIMTGSGKINCTEMMGDRSVDGWLFKPFRLSDMLTVLGNLGLVVC